MILLVELVFMYTFFTPFVYSWRTTNRSGHRGNSGKENAGAPTSVKNEGVVGRGHLEHVRLHPPEVHPEPEAQGEVGQVSPERRGVDEGVGGVLAIPLELENLDGCMKM